MSGPRWFPAEICCNSSARKSSPDRPALQEASRGTSSEPKNHLEPFLSHLGALLTGSLAVDVVFLPPNYRTAIHFSGSAKTTQGAAMPRNDVLAKRDQRRCGLGSDRA